MINPPISSISRMRAAKSKWRSRKFLAFAPNNFRMPATIRKRPPRPMKLTNENSQKFIPVAPAAIVTTLNGIGVKAAAARNHTPDGPVYISTTRFQWC